MASDPTREEKIHKLIEDWLPTHDLNNLEARILALVEGETAFKEAQRLTFENQLNDKLLQLRESVPRERYDELEAALRERTAEVEVANETILAIRDSHAERVGERDAATAEGARLRAALVVVATGGPDKACLLCDWEGETNGIGHSPTCNVGKALAAPPRTG